MRRIAYLPISSAPRDALACPPHAVILDPASPPCTPAPTGPVNHAVPTLRIVGGRGGGALILDEPSKRVRDEASRGERARRGAQGAEADFLAAQYEKSRKSAVSRIAQRRKDSRSKGSGAARPLGGGVSAAPAEGGASAAGKGKKKKPRHKHAKRDGA